MFERKAPESLINAASLWCPEIVDERVIVAGGFIRAYFAGEKPSDMDLYFRRESDFTAFTKLLLQNGWEAVADTPRAVTYLRDGKAVQLVRYSFGEPGDIIKMFDFTLCAAALTVYVDDEKPAGKLWLHDDFFEHLAGRVLVFQGSPLPLASLKRVVKYLKRGYSICDENLIAITEAISRQVAFDDQESMAEHIAGMDPDGARRIRVID